ncbi:MAG TPA: hypothetical protein VNN22_20080 [Verrucomicrobiae bacterium]|nr:hypothetical protein [Verrucomicrobiae bacterium]
MAGLVAGQKLQELEIMDLKIANQGKDCLIEQLRAGRTGFFDKLLSVNRTAGQLKAALRPSNDPSSFCAIALAAGLVDSRSMLTPTRRNH